MGSFDPNCQGNRVAWSLLVKKDYRDWATPTMLLGGLFVVLGTLGVFLTDGKLISVLFVLFGLGALWSGFRLRTRRKNSHM